ncbi:MAG: hypothetical protein FGM23_04595 [Alphaproteobacteria bacterium]|jgi:hypothetical protein|nr:hypothetical protein [Alphaproteobacteria bacterium]
MNVDSSYIGDAIMKTEDYIARLQDRRITNAEGRREAVDALVLQAENPVVQAALIGALSDPDKYVGWAAAEALAPKAEDLEFQSAWSCPWSSSPHLRMYCRWLNTPHC